MENIVIDNMNAATASLSTAGSAVFDWIMKIKAGILSKVTGTSDIGFLVPGTGFIFFQAVVVPLVVIGGIGLVSYLIYRKYKSSKA